MSSSEPENLETLINAEVRRLIAGAILFNLKVADEMGLNATDIQCLNLLELRGSATPGELARWAYLTTGGVTVVLDRMEKAGYIRREPNPEDRRSWIIRPVAARSRQLHARYREKGRELVHALAAFGEDELRLILDFLQRANSGRVEAKLP